LKNLIFALIVVSYDIVVADFSIQDAISSDTPKTIIKIDRDIEDSIRYRLKSPFKDKILQIYRLNEYQKLWSKNRQNFRVLLKLLNSNLFNYLDKDFNQKDIKYLSYMIDSGEIVDIKKAEARLDVLITDSYLKLIHFIVDGDTNWELVKQKLHSLKEKKDIRASWEIKPRAMPSAKEIYQSISKSKIEAFLYKQIPYPQRYIPLTKMLYKYRRMPDFPKLGEGQTLRRGSRDSRISRIKKRLQFFGDYPKNRIADNEYDRALSKAILNFKKRMNLKLGDYIDNKTIFYLNKTRDEYLKSIISTLEILKLYPHNMEDTRIEVNIPEYAMRFYQNSKEVFKSDVIVGRIDRPTPIFQSKMTYFVLNPTWTIPDNLVKRDLIPVLKQDPTYLERHNIHVYTSYSKNAPEVELDMDKLFSYEHSDKKVPYRFVQFPSNKNALGRVKFMFPNRYSVYLHDTDNKSLFKYRYRVFSSGCMRVKKPFDLMDILLQYARGSYSQEKIESILESNKTTEIVLKKPIPVYTTYFTAARYGGRDYFFYDIYMYAQIVWESMAGHTKPTFTIPKHRLVTIKKRGSRIYIERNR